jgi:hypothetical protein
MSSNQNTIFTKNQMVIFEYSIEVRIGFLITRLYPLTHFNVIRLEFQQVKK